MMGGCVVLTESRNGCDATARVFRRDCVTRRCIGRAKTRAREREEERKRGTDRIGVESRSREGDARRT